MAYFSVTGLFNYRFNAVNNPGTLVSSIGATETYTNGYENVEIDSANYSGNFKLTDISTGSTIQAQGTGLSYESVRAYAANGNYLGLLRISERGNDSIGSGPGIDASLQHQFPSNLIGGDGNDSFYQTSGHVDGGAGLNYLKVAPGVTGIVQTGDSSFNITGSYTRMGVSGPVAMNIDADNIQRIITDKFGALAFDISGAAGQG